MAFAGVRPRHEAEPAAAAEAGADARAADVI
jgi:hypothetical protein